MYLHFGLLYKRYGWVTWQGRINRDICLYINRFCRCLPCHSIPASLPEAGARPSLAHDQRKNRTLRLDDEIGVLLLGRECSYPPDYHLAYIASNQRDNKSLVVRFDCDSPVWRRDIYDKPITEKTHIGSIPFTRSAERLSFSLSRSPPLLAVRSLLHNPLWSASHGYLIFGIVLPGRDGRLFCNRHHLQESKTLRLASLVVLMSIWAGRIDLNVVTYIIWIMITAVIALQLQLL